MVPRELLWPGVTVAGSGAVVGPVSNEGVWGRCPRTGRAPGCGATVADELSACGAFSSAWRWGPVGERRVGLRRLATGLRPVPERSL
jgi:hypothetical protein